MDDVIGVLTNQPDSRRAIKYWSVLKTRLKVEGNELTINFSQLKLKEMCLLFRRLKSYEFCVCRKNGSHFPYIL